MNFTDLALAAAYPDDSLKAEHVENACASVLAYVQRNGVTYLAGAVLSDEKSVRRALRRSERRFIREARRAAMAEAGVPLWIRALAFIVPKLLPPPWNLVVAAIFFVVQFAVEHYADHPREFVETANPALALEAEGQP